MPSNYFVCLQTIIELSNLKLIPKEVIAWIFVNILKINYEDSLEEKDNSLSEQDLQMTFRTTNILKSVSNFLIMFGGFSLGSLCIAILARLTIFKFPKFNEKLVSIK